MAKKKAKKTTLPGTMFVQETGPGSYYARPDMEDLYVHNATDVVGEYAIVRLHARTNKTMSKPLNPAKKAAKKGKR